jgi:hypothetical protein
MKVYGLPGQGARPRDLQLDMGDPPWVDAYVDYRRNPGFVEEMRRQSAVVLAAYSLGGNVTADLSRVLDNIIGAVLYESPLLSDVPPGGSFPVLIIWNDGMLEEDPTLPWHSEAARRSRRRRKEAQDTLEAWRAGGRRVDLLYGRGGHTRWIWRPRTLFQAHNWNRSLNPLIERWIFNLQGASRMV